MATSLTIYANTGTSDVEVGDSNADFTEIDVDNDELIFSAGSDSVADGEPIPSDTQLNQAGLLLVTPRAEQTYDKYFLSDNSAGILKEIHNMGAGNYRYVLAFSFDGATASEPVLEVWDDSDLDSINNVSLGAGTPSNSWFRGITTTGALPGASWTGSRLAGSSDGHFLYLNDENGALSGADILYCQLKVVIPASQTDAGANTPVIAIKYATV
ncbi:MAG: hypothetical protein PVG65_01080 [Candidatus Thorarchaeota archaeon]|jgi:hypothetical protein